MKSKTSEYNDQINQTWASLKDFQKKTVNYVYDQLYKYNRKSFLIADEVGLGKTIIAKGLIAKAFQAFKPTKSNPTFNVIYICSNQSLATTNLRKLNFSKDESVVEAPLNRLIYLAFKNSDDDRKLRFDSLTPSTSFNLSNKSGVKDERAIIYALLTHYSEFAKKRNGLKWLLKSSVGRENWEKAIKDQFLTRKEDFRAKLFSQYKNKLQDVLLDSAKAPKTFKILGLTNSISVWALLLKACEKIDGRNYKKIQYKSELIFHLRHILTKICLEYLSAELIILDEFQRYSDLIDQQSIEVSPAVELARAVFELQNTKVLMLSATPFKPYTTSCDEDGGENHYSEFMKVLKFLMNGNDLEFWTTFEADRRGLFSILYSSESGLLGEKVEEMTEVKHRLQERYLQCMVRTERTLVSDDKNLMVKTSHQDVIKKFSPADIKDFIALDAISQKIQEIGKFRSVNPVEFSKSCPYALSFLSNYALRENLKLLISKPAIAEVLRKQKSAWLDLEAIRYYKPLGKGSNMSIVPNARLQELMEKTVHGDILDSKNSRLEPWKWLWIPPTINYYCPNSIFPETSNYSKTLLFSSWIMVPRAVSTILSYESERLAVSAYYKKRKERLTSYFTDSKKRKPGRLLQIKFDAKRKQFTTMNLLTLLYPSEYLRKIYDPEQNLFQGKPLNDIIETLSKTIEQKFYNLNLDKYETKGGESERWYWASLLLLDQDQNITVGNKPAKPKSIFASILNDFAITEDEQKTEKQFLQHCKSLIFTNEELDLGVIPPDLFKVLAIICLASPAVIFSRSLLKSDRLSNNVEKSRVLGYYYAQSKIKYMDKPESITVVRSNYPVNMSYWEAVLTYCLEGNIQSMTDEYIHMLADCDFIHDPYKIKNKFVEVLALRTVNFKIDDYTTIKNDVGKNIRTHFAVDFGNQNVETEGKAKRRISVRDTFNSPYRPFVLASTSIGQEGLDFHYYCSCIVHWNLPHNAIDLEQREGRINRYKGYIIRKNLVEKYLPGITCSHDGQTIWDKLFAQAWEQEGRNQGKCDLVPFWHIEPVGNYKIERSVPMYPFSKDIAKYARLKEILTFYRMTFGQPRQEELVEVLVKRGFSETEIESLIKNAMIDLTPPQVY